MFSFGVGLDIVVDVAVVGGLGDVSELGIVCHVKNLRGRSSQGCWGERYDRLALHMVQRGRPCKTRGQFCKRQG